MTDKTSQIPVSSKSNQASHSRRLTVRQLLSSAHAPVPRSCLCLSLLLRLFLQALLTACLMTTSLQVTYQTPSNIVKSRLP